MDDLAELLYKVYDNWGKERCLNVPDCFGQSFSDLEKEIRKTIPGRLDVSYQNSGQIYKVQPDDQIIRYEYGWFPKISVFEDIPGMYQEYKNYQIQIPDILQISGIGYRKILCWFIFWNCFQDLFYLNF